MARSNTGTGRPGSRAACAALLLLASAAAALACPTPPSGAAPPCGDHAAHPVPSPAAGGAVTAGGLVIAEPWARATPGGAKVGGGYLRITNAGREPDRLVGGSIEVAGRFEIHEMSVADGVMRMRPVGGIEIGPGASVDLKPGGLHAMFLDLKAPLREGQTVRGTLVFERAGTVPIAYRVRGIGASSAGAADHPH
jgi:copper(I)-binding protein